jgi:hypothetical protein
MAVRFVYGLSALFLFLPFVGVLLAPTSATPPRSLLEFIRFQAFNGLVALLPLAGAVFCWKRHRHWSREAGERK